MFKAFLVGRKKDPLGMDSCQVDCFPSDMMKREGVFYRDKVGSLGGEIKLVCCRRVSVRKVETTHRASKLWMNSKCCFKKKTWSAWQTISEHY